MSDFTACKRVHVCKKLLAVLLPFSLLYLGGCDSDWADIYCAARHPVEALSTNYKTCEQQHVIQKQAGGGDSGNIIFVNTAEHDYADRVKCAPWEESDDSWLHYWGDAHLRQAYKMGTYANGYHFMLYDHDVRSSGTLTLHKWDGVSHLLYMVASVSNFPTKEASYIGHQFDVLSDDKRRRPTQFIDAIIGVPIDFFELAIGVYYSAAGIVIGTLWHPWLTFKNILGGIVLIVQTMVVAAWNTIADIVSLVTYGHVQLQTANLFPKYGDPNSSSVIGCVFRKSIGN